MAPKPLAGLAVNSRYLYWANYQSGTIGGGSLNGTGVSQDIVSIGAKVRGVAVDPAGSGPRE